MEDRESQERQDATGQLMKEMMERASNASRAVRFAWRLVVIRSMLDLAVRVALLLLIGLMIIRLFNQ